MNTHQTGVGSRLLAGVLMLAGTWGVSAAQDDPPKPSEAPPAKPAARPDAPKAPKEKTVAFEMRDKPWPQVLEWLSDVTGLPVNTKDKPTGSMTYIAPRGAP